MSRLQTQLEIMMKRFEVYKKINDQWVFQGMAPSLTPEEAIATIKRYILNSSAKEWKAKELKVTKR